MHTQVLQMVKTELQLGVFAMLVFISVPLGERFFLKELSRLHTFLVQVSPGGNNTLKGKVHFSVQ